MNEPIEHEYFNWLCAKVLSTHIPNYYDLMKILYTTEFIWIISGDRNRKEDGLELRQHFLNESGWDKNILWFNEPCSIFETLIAFSQRVSFQTDMPVKDWFWIFLENLNLNEYRQVSNTDKPIIEDILYTFIWRTYTTDGYGGLFPMRYPKQDLRKVELWYQFCFYVEENELV